jgi:hypothetical protein
VTHVAFDVDPDDLYVVLDLLEEDAKDLGTFIETFADDDDGADAHRAWRASINAFLKAIKEALG